MVVVRACVRVLVCMCVYACVCEQNYSDLNKNHNTLPLSLCYLFSTHIEKEKQQLDLFKVNNSDDLTHSIQNSWSLVVVLLF